MEEDNREEKWKVSRKVRLNRSSRIWKRDSEGDGVSNDVSNSDSDETAGINEATNENVNLEAVNEGLTSDVSDIEDSTVVLEEFNESKDVTEERDDNDHIVRRKRDEINKDDNEGTSDSEDETLQSQDEELKVKGGASDETSDIDDKKNSKNKKNLINLERILQTKKNCDEDLENDEFKIVHDTDRDETISNKDENEDEKNECEEPSDGEVPDPCAQDETEHYYDKSGECKPSTLITAAVQCNDYNLEETLDNDEMTSNDDVFEDTVDDDEHHDKIETKESTSSDNNVNKNIINYQIANLIRSVSEREYDFLFRDPIDDLNSLLQEKENSNYTATDGIMSRPSDILTEREKEEEENSSKFEFEEELPSVSELINSRALSKHATTYELEKFEKNALIIFNQENINGYYPRLGTRKDAEALTNTFGKYGFEIHEHVDFSRDEIFRELKKFSEQDFTHYGCVAVAILTHGSDMGELKAKDRKFFEMDVINFFKTQQRPTLVTKPKIIIIQACRGSKTTQAVHVMRAGKISKDHDDGDAQHYTLPVEADTLVLHSTYVGNTSHRDHTHGSWLVQTLCKKINELAETQDLETIITEVKREVAIDKVHEEYNRRTLETDYNKQMPVVTSTLIRKLYLKKYEEDVPRVTELDSSANVNDDEATLHLNFLQRPSISGLETVILPCDCFLDWFQYMRDCMRHFVEDNPEDDTAKSFLEVAEVLHEGSDFDVAKKKISKAMRNHLQNKAKEFDFYKYLYMYKD